MDKTSLESRDAETLRYGSVFQRIICIAGPFTAITMVILTIFQSVGHKLKPLILSMLRKGDLRLTPAPI